MTYPALLPLALAPAALASDTPRGAVTLTRAGALFTDLENQLLGAMQDRDRSPVEALFDEGFAALDPAGPSLRRSNLVAAALSMDIQEFRDRELTVREFPNTSVVSFSLSLVASPSRSGGAFFVVDVWTKSAEGWLFSQRYVARTSLEPTAGGPLLRSPLR
jgi:hypothetical protein